MSNNKLPKTPKEHLQQMNILHLALLGGQLMLALMLYIGGVYTPANEDTAPVKSLGGLDPMVLIACLLFVVLVGASFFIFNKRKAEGVQLKGTLMEKLAHYRQSFLLRAAMIEGPNLVVIIFYFFMVDHIVLIALFVIGIAAFLMIRPTADRISQDYQLSSTEQSSLRSSH